MSGQFRAANSVPPKRHPQVPLREGMGATQRRSGCFGGDSNLFSPLSIKARLLRRVNSNAATLPTKLSRPSC